MLFIPYYSGSSGNLYAVEDGGKTLLLDPGVTWRKLQYALNFSVVELAGCLVTHAHADHLDTGSVRHLLGYGVPVFCSAGASRSAKVEGVNVVSDRSPFRVGDSSLRAIPFAVPHDADEPLAFLISGPTGKLVYLADAMYCPHRFSGVTHFALEANYDPAILDARLAAGKIDEELAARIRRSHMSIDQCISTLAANDLSKVEHICLLHLSSANANAAEFIARVKEATGRYVTVAQERPV